MIRPRRDDAATLRTRLDAGEWLLLGEVGELFRHGDGRPTSRFTVRNWVAAGKIGVRRTPGNQRICDPEDVQRLLVEFGQVHRAAPKAEADPVED